MNPSVDRDDLTLAINETETTCDVEIARAAHRMYSLTLKEADGVIEEVATAVKTWRAEAEGLRIRRSEQDKWHSRLESRRELNLRSTHGHGEQSCQRARLQPCHKSLVHERL